MTGVLVIRQSLIRTKKHGLKPDRPKSDTSYRSVVLGDQAISLLKQHRRKQQEIKLKMGQAYDDQDWVFCRPDGTPWDPKTCYSHFKKLLAKAGLPPQTTLHHMRHNFVTGRIDAGHDIKEVSEDAGHAGIGITKRYDHETLERKRKAARELEERFFSKPRARKRRTGKRSAGRP